MASSDIGAWAFALLVYFLPTLLTLWRPNLHIEDRGRIFFINLLAGWTILGWLYALAGVFTATTEDGGHVVKIPIGATEMTSAASSQVAPPVPAPAAHRETKVVQVTYETGWGASAWRTKKKLDRVIRDHVKKGWNVANLSQTSERSFFGTKVVNEATLLFERLR